MNNIKNLFWLLTIITTIFLWWTFSSILLPFIAGIAIAYFLSPVVAFLEKKNIARWAGTLIVLFTFFGLLAAIFIIFLPLLIDQTITFLRNIPQFISWSLGKIDLLITEYSADLNPTTITQIKKDLAELGTKIIGQLGNLTKTLLNNGLAIANFMTLIAITPLVAFYLLRDWKKLTSVVVSSIPRHNLEIAQKIAADINQVLFGYVGGTALVTLTLGIFYALTLTIIGLNYGLVIGLMAGFISFIPYIGTTIGLLTSVGVAIWQDWPSWQMPIIAFITFMVGQVLNDYILLPRLVGDKIKLHPLWVIFALFAGATTLGFVGVLLAMPIAGVCGVLIRYLFIRYKSSNLYKGENNE